jgi:hypothetical protein
MVRNKRFDGLARLGLELNLIENNERVTIHQLDMVNKLKPKKNVIEIRHIIEQIKDLLRTFSEINENV